VTVRVFGAVDLGAASGRVMAGVVEDGTVTLHTIHRFPNAPEERDGHLRWNLSHLFEEVLAGVTRLGRDFPTVESIGIDTWAVDYGLLDADGRLLAEPVAYRDPRTTTDVVDAVHTRVPPEELYQLNGLQFLPFNTLYQLEAERREPLWEQAAHVVLLPDLLAYWLTGELRTEATNASTTGLLDVHTGEWSDELLTRLDLPATRLPPVEDPGVVRGRIRPELCDRLGLAPSAVVTTVGSHDTASAVVAVPADSPNFAYISSGTWSLVGLELDQPVLGPEARAANFTNERGVGPSVRFLRNVGGLWLLQESLRAWGRNDLTTLLTAAEALPPGGPVIEVDDPAFFPPGDMPGRIAAAAGQELAPAETVRCVLDSLAATYATTVRQAAELADVPVDVVHIVGGGSQNQLLCHLTAEATGLPVTTGPVEATALGNVIVQARSHGVEVRHDRSRM
jgi:rhamnulokinase